MTHASNHDRRSPTRASRAVRFGTPLLILAVGVTALLGCFEIPATHALQVNGKRRPEHLISDKDDEPIVVGRTNLVDALLVLQPVTRIDRYMGSLGPAVRLGEEPFNWELTPDGRHAAVHYEMRTATRVWPLCFAAEPVSEMRKILFTLDEHGTIVGRVPYDPSTEKPEGSQGLVAVFGETAQEFPGLDPATRRRLIDAKLMPRTTAEVNARAKTSEGPFHVQAPYPTPATEPTR